MQPATPAPAGGLRRQLEPGLQLVHRRLNVRTILVRIPLDHRQRLVSADPLHCGQIDAGLNKMGNRGVAQGVPKDLVWVQPGGGDDAAKGLAHVHRVPRPCAG